MPMETECSPKKKWFKVTKIQIVEILKENYKNKKKFLLRKLIISLKIFIYFFLSLSKFQIGYTITFGGDHVKAKDVVDRVFH
jgi:hypothetical protein